MREISTNTIVEAVAKLCVEANIQLPITVVAALVTAYEIEDRPSFAKMSLEAGLKNLLIAVEEDIPICQDTGIAVVFIEIGQDVHIVDGSLVDAINAGVAKGYTEGHLRASIVRHPIDRVNTGDNTPAIIHTETVLGNQLKITLMPKGAGSENMSAVKMLLLPGDKKGVKKFVLETVKSAKKMGCFPIIVGIGLGGTMETAALLAKKALLRNIADDNKCRQDAELEYELLQAINQLGFGAGTVDGKITALAVKVNSHPCHTASMPVAVNIQCHAARHKEIIL